MSQTGQPSSKERRRRYFVDPEVQGILLQQAVWHWLWASATFVLVILVFRVFPAWLSGTDQQSGRLWYHLAPYLSASAVLFPIVFFRTVRFSNRFVGPMVRIRRALKQLVRGDTPARIVLRKRDFWSDVAEDINEIAATFCEKQPSTAAVRHSEENESTDDSQAVVC